MQAESLAMTRALPHVCSGIVFAEACTGQSTCRPGPTRRRSPLAGGDSGSKDKGKWCGQERRCSRCIRGIQDSSSKVTCRSSGWHTAIISTSAVGMIGNRAIGWRADAVWHWRVVCHCGREPHRLSALHGRSTQTRLCALCFEPKGIGDVTSKIS